MILTSSTTLPELQPSEEKFFKEELVEVPAEPSRGITSKENLFASSILFANCKM